MMYAQPEKEHEWLQRLVGEWKIDAESDSGGGVGFTGHETVRSLGGIWFVAEGQGEMTGGRQDTSVMTLGFDPNRRHYVGTWIGTAMNFLWVYEGHLNQERTSLILDCEGPSMKGDGSMSRYRDVIEFLSDDHRLLRGLSLEEDGQWSEFMVAHYRRQR